MQFFHSVSSGVAKRFPLAVSGVLAVLNTMGRTRAEESLGHAFALVAGWQKAIRHIHPQHAVDPAL